MLLMFSGFFTSLFFFVFVSFLKIWHCLAVSGVIIIPTRNHGSFTAAAFGSRV
ncbi:hypothetical protein OF83DRAFT_1174021 [Amylostereum chailletii]|nr:hypothetical protein OF83DRAFT_1174021 [Amylostereum chailletii]